MPLTVLTPEAYHFKISSDRGHKKGLASSISDESIRKKHRYTNEYTDEKMQHRRHHSIVDTRHKAIARNSTERLMIVIRDLAAHDVHRVIALNESEVLQTSPMDEDHLRSLVRLSSARRVATVDEVVVAFLIAIASDAPYQNDNYRWFSERFSNFLYVDRVVVRADFSGRGIGGKLYADMFDLAQSQGIGVITCEYNVDPPNPASHAFHSRFGFAEVGSQWVSKHSKKVSLQALNMQAAPRNP